MKGLSMRGWVASEIWNHPHRFEAAKEKILAGLASGHLRPVIAQTFEGLENIAALFRSMEEDQKRRGKLGSAG
jgi:NADPH:quinone reductase-like Zn-dependent oxidoreductase